MGILLQTGVYIVLTDGREKDNGYTSCHFLHLTIALIYISLHLITFLYTKRKMAHVGNKLISTRTKSMVKTYNTIFCLLRPLMNPTLDQLLEP